MSLFFSLFYQFMYEATIIFTNIYKAPAVNIIIIYKFVILLQPAKLYYEKHLTNQMYKSIIF